MGVSFRDRYDRRSDLQTACFIDVNFIDVNYDAICQQFPQRIQKLFNSLNLDYPGLEEVRAAVNKRNWPAACAALVVYYQQSSKYTWFHDSTAIIPADTLTIADHILNDQFTFQLVSGQVPRTATGSIDWNWLGPRQDSEWAWFLNRHYHLLTLLNAFQLTGNSKYVHCLSAHLLDWVLSSPCWHQPHIWAQWRGLEVSYRVLHWAPIFYLLQSVEALNPTVRLLMLSSLPDHAFYLRRLHDWGDNWVYREMNALATIALAWPEFKQSPAWLNYAQEHLVKAIHDQVYPDGAHKELTSHYHRIALRDLQNFTNLLTASGRQVPAICKSALEQMWSYLAYTLNPQGRSLLNNDSDQEDLRALLTAAARVYQRQDWHYIASRGTQGIQPPTPPSIVFPWAGQLVMRNGWGTAAHWGFFDFGPLGINYHGHQDQLHVSISAYGRDLLVDSGRHSYVRSHLWRYFRGSASHNVVLIDGQGQQASRQQWQQPAAGNYLVTPEFDFAQGNTERSFGHLAGRVSHSRAIVYLRGQYWVVVDWISTDRPRRIQPLWHFHPTCTLSLETPSLKAPEVTSVDLNLGNLRIVPVADFPWQVEIVSGQEKPVQGWWSREYGHLSPSPVAVYQAEIASSQIFAWVLFPAQGQVPAIQVRSLAAPVGSLWLQISPTDQPTQEVIVQMDEQQVIQLGNQHKFRGKCAILRPEQPPLLAYGCLTDRDDQLICQHA